MSLLETSATMFSVILFISVVSLLGTHILCYQYCLHVQVMIYSKFQSLCWKMRKLFCRLLGWNILLSFMYSVGKFDSVINICFTNCWMRYKWGECGFRLHRLLFAETWNIFSHLYILFLCNPCSATSKSWTFFFWKERCIYTSYRLVSNSLNEWGKSYIPVNIWEVLSTLWLKLN